MYAGQDVGDRATLMEIQQAKDNDPANQYMGEEDHKEAIDDLLAYHMRKSSNAHVTSKGVAQDVSATMEKIEAKVRQCYHLSIFSLTQSLYSSPTFMYGEEYYAMVTCASVNDMIQPL